MIGITEQAIQALLRLRTSAEIQDPGTALRLTPDRVGHLQLVVDSEREGDRTVEHEGSKLLLIGEDVFDALSGATIDCQMTPRGPELILDRSRIHSGNGNGRLHGGFPGGQIQG